MIKGVAFDLDGIITDTAEFHFQAWKDLAESLDIKIDRAFNENLKGVSREESLRRILVHGDKLDDFSEEEFNELANNKNNHYKELILDITPDDLLPGILEFLNELKENKIPMVIASASKNAPQILKNLGVENLFDHVVDPASLQHSKPAPDIFLAAAKAINVKPEEMVGIEDAEAVIFL